MKQSDKKDLQWFFAYLGLLPSSSLAASCG